MPSIKSAISSPASTITNATETLAVNIPASPIQEPGSSPQAVIVRGSIKVTTGTSTTALTAKLRVGQNNTTTAQVGQSMTVPAVAGSVFAVPFHFIDTAGPGNLNASGYSLTITQVGGAANGTLQEVTYEVDYSYS